MCSRIWYAQIEFPPTKLSCPFQTNLQASGTKVESNFFSTTLLSSKFEFIWTQHKIKATRKGPNPTSSFSPTNFRPMIPWDVNKHVNKSNFDFYYTKF